MTRAAIASSIGWIPELENGGPARTRTWDQGIHFTRSFLNGADYLITLNRIVRGGTLEPVIKDTKVPR
jgi:hypothetical protein